MLLIFMLEVQGSDFGVIVSPKLPARTATDTHPLFIHFQFFKRDGGGGEWKIISQGFAPALVYITILSWSHYLGFDWRRML